MSRNNLPHTLDIARMGLHQLQLLDPNDAELTGTIARKRDFKQITPGQHEPHNNAPLARLLSGWNDHCLRHRLLKPDFTVESWEQARWDAADTDFLETLGDCTAPEDVDDIMPQKWKPHRSDVDSDPRLERVAKLCTSVVNRVVDWTSGNPAWAPRSVADWQRCEQLQKRIQEMLELLETTLGEAVGVTALRDAAFLKRCWRAMSEEDHGSWEDSLETASRDAFTDGELSDESFDLGRGGGGAAAAARGGAAAARGGGGGRNFQQNYQNQENQPQRQQRQQQPRRGGGAPRAGGGARAQNF